MTPEQQPASANPVITAEMHAEIEAAMQELEKSGAAEPKAGKTAGIRGPRVIQGGREHRHGKVVSIGPSDIFIEFGPKELGILPRVQYPDDLLPTVGDMVEVVIDKYETSENVFICSRPGAVQKAAWEFLEPGQVVEGRVTGVASKETKQVGLELEIAGHKAFMPAGQISLDHVKDLSVFVGEKMKCTITRVERSGRGNIVVSRREMLQQERAELAEKLKSSLAEGQTVAGVVRKIMEFGAFVDIGGIDGLPPVSDRG